MGISEKNGRKLEKAAKKKRAKKMTVVNAILQEAENQIHSVFDKAVRVISEEKRKNEKDYKGRCLENVRR